MKNTGSSAMVGIVSTLAQGARTGAKIQQAKSECPHPSWPMIRIVARLSAGVASNIDLEDELNLRAQTVQPIIQRLRRWGFIEFAGVGQRRPYVLKGPLPKLWKWIDNPKGY